MVAFDCHKRGLIEILGITCVYGNVMVDKVIRNVLLTQRLFNLKKNIKVYKGCGNPLMTNLGFEDGFMGADGLGNSTETMAQIDVKHESEDAAHALVRLAKQYPKQIKLLTLGPVTNIALAHHIDPQFFDNLGQVVSMGGLLDTMGNVGPTTEFNYFNDPEAVHVLLANSQCPLIIVPWDTCLKLRMPWSIFDEIINSGKERGHFIHKIYENQTHHKVFGRSSDGVVLCDITVVIAALFPELVSLSSDYPVAIELSGHLTRGQLVVDRTGRTQRKRFTGHRNAQFMTDMNVPHVIELLKQMVH
ncbi:unnamed protein product, partial [Medioppia subpectinata]